MNKITTEIRYKEMSFNFIKQVRELKMYFSTDSDYAIIVDESENVLFELGVCIVQNFAYLTNGNEEL